MNKTILLLLKDTIPIQENVHCTYYSHVMNHVINHVMNHVINLISRSNDNTKIIIECQQSWVIHITCTVTWYWSTITPRQRARPYIRFNYGPPCLYFFNFNIAFPIIFPHILTLFLLFALIYSMYINKHIYHDRHRGIDLEVLLVSTHRIQINRNKSLRRTQRQLEFARLIPLSVWYWSDRDDEVAFNILGDQYMDILGFEAVGIGVLV